MERYGQNQRVQLSITDGLAELRMVHPEKRNAFSIELSKDFADLIAVALECEETRALLITAEGSVFSGGADVEVLTDGTPEERERLGDFLLDGICHPLHQTTIPVVAAARGPAAGGGATILCYSADFQIVSPNVDIWWPEVEFGSAPLGRAIYLANQIGESRALELMTLGKDGMISAEEAHRLGIVTRLVNKDKVEQEARSLAKTLVRHDRNHEGIIETFIDVVHHARQEGCGVSMDYAHLREDEI